MIFPCCVGCSAPNRRHKHVASMDKNISPQRAEFGCGTGLIGLRWRKYGQHQQQEPHTPSKQQQLEALELVLAGDNKKGGASSSPTSQDDQKGGNSMLYLPLDKLIHKIDWLYRQQLGYWQNKILFRAV